MTEPVASGRSRDSCPIGETAPGSQAVPELWLLQKSFHVCHAFYLPLGTMGIIEQNLPFRVLTPPSTILGKSCTT